MTAWGSRPTLVTVARLAGVSVASASRVLHGGPATPAMAQKVRAAAEQLGYVPNAAARSLRAGRTRQLALAVADVGNPTYVAMMRGVESVIGGLGYRLLVHSTGADTGDEVSLLESLGNRYVDGLIIAPIRINHQLLRALTTAAAPVAVIGNVPEGSLFDHVPVDSGAGLRLAAEHLVQSGRQALALVNGPDDTVPGAERLAAFEAVVDAAGLTGGCVTQQAADFTYAAGLEAARSLLRRFRPDAVIGSNDLLALGAIRALAERGWQVPADVAVAGVDDTDLARMHVPSLTSVSLQARERGQLAAEMMVSRLAQPDLPPRRQVVVPHLVARESSQPPGTPR
jgi:LacI family transcriptional regulator, galactose operon repressor